MSDTQAVRIGVDIGGTFTDLQIFDARTGAITSFKTPTTPDDPSIGLMAGIAQAADRDGFAFADIGYLVHGTTIATNAVLEGKLAKGALVTTAGFEDVVEIGRHYRREVYTLSPQLPPNLIPRDRRVGVVERITANGAIEMALTHESLDGLVERLSGFDVAAVAICLMSAYVNAEHEIRIAEHLAQKMPALRVSYSSALSAEIREYERTSTTILNALLIPVVAGYLEKLRARMRAAGFTPRLLLVQSNGGVCSVETAAREPARLLLSGPSGGSAACALLGQQLGEKHIVGVDMGGTSFDVSIVRDGRANLIMQGEIDRMPVRLPMVEIRTIGAGGGSLAHVEPGGRLKVGPQSAGSRPGPACYGHGGTGATVTDANVVLGRLDAGQFLGGGMRLDAAAARSAVERVVGQPLDLSVEAAAEGLLTVTNANLGAAIRLSLFEKGLDPAEFVMVAFGGAAGVHATAVADEMNIRRVVFPNSASTLSAFGILHSDLSHDLVRSHVLAAVAENIGALRGMAEELATEADSRLDADAVTSADRRVELAADMRYKAQAFELTVPVRGLRMDAEAFSHLIDDFHAMHRARFSYSNPGTAVEIVSLRASAVGVLGKPHAKSLDGESATAHHTTPAMRPVWLDGGWRDVVVWRRDQIASGVEIAGPVVIEEDYTTVLMTPGWTCRRHDSGHLIADRLS